MAKDNKQNVDKWNVDENRGHTRITIIHVLRTHIRHMEHILILSLEYLGVCDLMCDVRV